MSEIIESLGFWGFDFSSLFFDIKTLISSGFSFLVFRGTLFWKGSQKIRCGKVSFWFYEIRFKGQMQIPFWEK